MKNLIYRFFIPGIIILLCVSQIKADAGTLADNPVLYIYEASEDVGEYWWVEYEEDAQYDPLFNLGKDILCSDNPYAKELVKKYDIRSGGITCPTRGDQ